MIRLLSSKLADFLCEKSIIPEEDKEIYIYGNELLISSFIGIALVCIVGVLLGEFLSALVFLVVFIINRQFSGGYHASTFIKCTLIFLCDFFVVLFMSKMMLQYYSPFVWISLTVVHLAVIIDLAPMGNKNKPISPEKRIKGRKKIIVISLFFELLSGLMIFVDKNISINIALTLLSISMLMIFQKFNGGENDG